MLLLPKYSFGVGDRFGREGEAQLMALVKALERGMLIVPVWNKSNREHELIGTNPDDVVKEAFDAVHALRWGNPYFTDADHISLENVYPFLGLNYFTIGVDKEIGQEPRPDSLEDFVKRYSHLTEGPIEVPGIEEPLKLTREELASIGKKYLVAVEKAAATYDFITRKRSDDFVTEVSMDETDVPQSPLELLFILSELARRGVPVQTIAPKFPGDFHKGVDSERDPEQFREKLLEYRAVIAYAIKNFDLPENLKLSVHSGSDKFSIYPILYDVLVKPGEEVQGTGVHVKTAGTTWLEELIGLAAAGGEAFGLVKEIFKLAYPRYDELAAPYAPVLDINRANLPTPQQVRSMINDQFVHALRHDSSNIAYNRDLRQFMHISYKIPAEMGRRWLDALDANRAVIARNVTENLYDRHVVPIFFGGSK